MPVNANNMIVGKKKGPKKAPRKLSNSINANEIVVKNKPIQTPSRPETKREPTKKYETLENGELVRKINIKSGYMRDVFDID